MKKRRITLYMSLTLAIMTTLVLMSFAVVQYLPREGEQEALLFRAPKVTTDTWAVFDVETGDIRYGSNPTKERPIASVTKLFTAYMVMYTETETTPVTLTEGDINTEGAFGKLKAGETLTLRDLLFPLLLESSNDAGAAITRSLGSLYPNLLGGVVSRVGLSHTHIVDGTGLSKDNTSTPEDLAHFFAHIRSTYPHISDITQLRMYITKERGLVNNNPARGFESFRGGKQGYTPEAGKTFVGSFVVPARGSEVGLVILGSSDLPGDISRILKSLK